MSAGILSYTRRTGSPLRATLPCRRSDGTTGVVGQVKLPSEYRSFVSGPSYERLIKEGAKPHGQTLTELFSNSWSGDTGHEYMKKRIKRWDSHHTMWNSTSSSFTLERQRLWIPSGRGVETQLLPDAIPHMSDNQLAAESTGFLQGTLPLQSEADLLQAVIELLREGLPHQLFGALVGTKSSKKSHTVRALAGDYLNYVFGISPIVREADKVIRTIARIGSITDQWIRDNGVDVARRRNSVPETDTTVKVYSGTGRRSGVLYGPPLPGSSEPWSRIAYDSSWNQLLTVEDKLTTKTRMHFSASYNYDLTRLALGLPVDVVDGTSVELRMALAARILGISPGNANLSLAWELFPFSWLVDWFVNIGQVIDVATTLNQAGLRVKFAYLTLIQEFHWEQSFHDSRISGTATGFNVIDAFYMRRLRATPFGFGSSFESLNPFQSSILAALAVNFGLH